MKIKIDNLSMLKRRLSYDVDNISSSIINKIGSQIVDDLSSAHQNVRVSSEKELSDGPVKTKSISINCKIKHNTKSSDAQKIVKNNNAVIKDLLSGDK